MRRLIATPLALVLATAFVSACGGDDDDNESGIRPDTPPETSTVAPTTTTAPEPPETTTTSPPNLDAVSMRLEQVVDGLESPVAIAFRPGDDRMYVAEQPGRLRVIVDGAPADPPVLEIAVSRGNEQGLLGVAFSPDGSKVYVHYTDDSDDVHIDEYTMNGDVADTASRRELLFAEHPYGNHNGGQLVTGADGMLYISIGDGGSGGDPFDNGQNTSSLLGKILRIDPNGDPYTIPSDNPFVGNAAARPEIWMYGLRNPWRFTFDRVTGDTWIADVGQNKWEEVDFAAVGQGAGANWGWNEREGLHEFEGDLPEGARDPIAERPLGDYCALIGGYAYRGTAIASLNGVYLFSDNCRGEVEAIVQQGGVAVDQRDLGLSVESPTTFGEDAAGELYIAARGGEIYKFVPA